MKEYLVTSPRLPKDAASPVMSHAMMTDWLNDMAAQGWNYDGYAQTVWSGYEPHVQEWWIFSKEQSV